MLNDDLVKPTSSYCCNFINYLFQKLFNIIIINYFKCVLLDPISFVTLLIYFSLISNFKDQYGS
jgi:hypothetical protein